MKKYNDIMFTIVVTECAVILPLYFAIYVWKAICC